MSKFSVVTEDLAAAKNKLIGFADDYQKISNNLLNAATTMGSAYDSKDNLDFVNKIQAFGEHLKAMSEKLRQGAETIGQQGENYQKRCDDNSAQATKLPT